MKDDSPTSLRAYLVIAELAAPDLPAERRFVVTERQYVARERARIRKSWRGWGWLRRGLGTTTLRDWDHYDDKLERYGKTLDKLEREIAEGLMPLKFTVIHEGDETDRRVAVKLTVEEGELHKDKQVPERPRRIDRPEPVQWPDLRLVGRFRRNQIRITPHAISVLFSRMEAKDTAYVVNKTVFMELSEKTRVFYEVRVNNSEVVERGEVGLVD